MATGPDHYREAERLLAEAAEFPDALLHIDRQGVTAEEAADAKRRFEEIVGNKKTLVTAQPVTVDMSSTLAAAQVHATLALAAATAHPIVKAHKSREDWPGDFARSEDKNGHDWTQVT